jgi:hypothetical protein
MTAHGSNVIQGLGEEQAGRIKALRERSEFFWPDLELDSDWGERFGKLLHVSDHVLEVLRDFSSARSIFPRSYVEPEQAVCPAFCIRNPQAAPVGPDGMEPMRSPEATGEPPSRATRCSAT